jgi:hypothetical protein
VSATRPSVDRVPHFSRSLREVGLLAHSPRYAREQFQYSYVNLAIPRAATCYLPFSI